MIRTIILWLLFLKYSITHREINYKGFSVICSLSGGKITIGGYFVVLQFLQQHVGPLSAMYHSRALWRQN